ncbi:response regulator [Aquincola tertiaricarbonis]|uniref:Response regulator n=1 Tax=Aquincola tertiaricarbonis TaxID=391953 RepID=A0ABY4SDV8_AQUTE|nr:response regulator [Aquincola tertiaricarbonis]URI09216.1 response regulator [Aquincola tertiaricarbonis]
MNLSLPTPDLFWSQTWEAFGPYLVPTLIAGALFVVLLLVGRRGEGRLTSLDEAPRTDSVRPLRAVEPVAEAHSAARQAIADAAASAAATTAVVAAAATGEPLPPPGQPAGGEPATPPALLVVDDSAVVRAKLRKLLEGAGYRVVLANDGHEALAALPRDFFSVLITDLEMPNMGGVELIAHVQGSQETEDLPILAITGHDELQAHVRECQGLYGIFRKPWNDRELLRRVEALAGLRVRQATPAA